MSFRAPGRGSACAVCGDTDVRALTTTRLASGDVLVVCGTHELMHRRASKVARSFEELRDLVRERRGRRERRRPRADELGAALDSAFRDERRAAGERRR